MSSWRWRNLLGTTKTTNKQNKTKTHTKNCWNMLEFDWQPHQCLRWYFTNWHGDGSVTATPSHPPLKDYRQNNCWDIGKGAGKGRNINLLSELQLHGWTLPSNNVHLWRHQLTLPFYCRWSKVSSPGQGACAAGPWGDSGTGVHCHSALSLPPGAGQSYCKMTRPASVL